MKKKLFTVKGNDLYSDRKINFVVSAITQKEAMNEAKKKVRKMAMIRPKYTVKSL